MCMVLTNNYNVSLDESCSCLSNGQLKGILHNQSAKLKQEFITHI